MHTPWVTMQCLSFLVRLVQPTHIIEVGTYAGYSALGFALATKDIPIHTLDRDLHLFQDTKALWAHHPEAPRIQAHLGPALQTLPTLNVQGRPFYYIDADKRGYAHYYQHIKAHAPTGTLMAFDNTLSEGQILHISPTDTLSHKANGQKKTGVKSPLTKATPQAKPYVQAIHAFNQKVVADDTTHSLLLPIGDGLTVAIKL